MLIEFREGPFITKKGEFKYRENDVYVMRGQEYDIVTYDTKDTVYVLKSTNLAIYRDEKTMIEQYKSVAQNTKRDEYPKRVYLSGEKLSRGKDKFIQRVFARNALREDAEPYEVEAVTKTNTHVFVTIEWQIRGNIGQAMLFNEKQILSVKSIMPELAITVPTDQLHATKYIEEQINLIDTNY